MVPFVVPADIPANNITRDKIPENDRIGRTRNFRFILQGLIRQPREGLILVKEVSYLLCYNDTIQSKDIPSATKNTIDRKEKNIDGKVFLGDEGYYRIIV